MKDKYQKLLAEHPPIVSLEQFRIMCHISKRKANYILTSGIIPCVNSGKKTRQFKVAMKDIVRYLKETKANPGKYVFPSFSSGVKAERIGVELPGDRRFFATVKMYYKNLLDSYPDLLPITDAAEIIGYSKKTVFQWIGDGKLTVIRKNGYLIPKSVLLSFVADREFVMRQPRSEKHHARLMDVMQLYDARNFEGIS